jgi:release factor glutamine methyltransferase
VTIRDAIRDGAALLEKGSASPWLDASLLLGHSLGMDRTMLMASYPDELPPAAPGPYRALIERRASGEPVAYIVGRKEFRGIEFEVGPSVLVPRPETEILVETALAAAAEDMADAASSDRVLPYRVHDACAGSGCVGISLALELPGALGGRASEVELSDISDAALETASRNASRILGAPLPLFRWDFLSGAAPRSYDVVVANPPYLTGDDMSSLPPELAREPSLALSGGVDGLDPLRVIAPRAAAALLPGGTFAAEIGSYQGEAARGLLAAAGFRLVRVSRDLAGLDRVVSGRLPRVEAPWTN